MNITHANWCTLAPFLDINLDIKQVLKYFKSDYVEQSMSPERPSASGTLFLPSVVRSGETTSCQIMERDAIIG